MVAPIEWFGDEIERRLREAAGGRLDHSGAAGQPLHGEGGVEPEGDGPADEDEASGRDGIVERQPGDHQLFAQGAFEAEIGDETFHAGNLTGWTAPDDEGGDERWAAEHDWKVILPDGTRVDTPWANLTPTELLVSPDDSGTDGAFAAGLRARWLHAAANADRQGGPEGTSVSMSRGARVHELFRLHAMDGRSWELRPGQVLHLGTHPANDVVLDDEAGEIQAQVRWSSGERAPLLSARRGWRSVRLDARPVLGAVPLRSGHLIEVAGESFRVEMVQCALLDLPELEAIDLLCPPPPQEDEGSFSNASAARTWLTSVLTGLETAERTGVLRLVVDAQTAMVAFDHGQVVDASCGDLVGLAALEQIRVGTSGAWRFTPQQVVRPGPLDVSIDEFLTLGYWELARRRAIRMTDARTPA